MGIKSKNADRSDRVILFTLVDLLTQFIFLALFLVTLFQQSNNQLLDTIQRELIPYQRVAQPELASFINAVSKLVPLADINKSQSVGDRDEATRTSLRSLSDLLARMRAENFSAEQMEKLMISQSSLSSAGRSDMLNLIARAAAMTGVQREKLIAAARTIATPVCFGGRFAFSVEEVPGGYIFSNAIPAIYPEFQKAAGLYQRLGGGAFVALSNFSTFGEQMGRAFKSCNIRVSETSDTNSESQYKLLGEYFWLGGP